MKVLNGILIVCMIAVVFSSCRKKEESANLTFEFENYVDAQKIVKDGPVNYTNAAGNKYNVSLLKYYISNIILVAADGTETAFENHDLIDAFGVITTDPVEVAGGEYVSMKFMFGVDADNNTSGTQSGDLDPSQGMFWSWSTGYIFSKHEGKFKNASNAEDNMEYHLGRQQMATELEIPLSDLVINGTDKKAVIRFNLNNMYNSPAIDFTVGTTTKHSSSSDAQWMDDMKANLVDVFSYRSSIDL